MQPVEQTQDPPVEQIHTNQFCDIGICNDPIPENEKERVEVLRKSKLIEDPNLDKEIRRYCELAVRIFNVPVAYFNLVDSDLLFFKSILGADFTIRPRSGSLCSFVICEEANVITLSLDTLKDERFSLNKNVVNGPKIRFYAGLPVTLDGVNIGTFCIADIAPKTSFSQKEIEMLTEMAGIISDLLSERQRRLLSTSVDSARFVVSLLHGLKPALAQVVAERDNVVQHCPCKRGTSPSTVAEFVNTLNMFQESLRYLSNEIETSLSLGILSLQLHIGTMSASENSDRSSSSINSSSNGNSQLMIGPSSVSEQPYSPSTSSRSLEDWMLLIQKSTNLPKPWNDSHHVLRWYTTTSTTTLTTASSCGSYGNLSKMMYSITQVNTEIIGLIITWLLRRSLNFWTEFDVELSIKPPSVHHRHHHHCSDDSTLPVEVSGGRLLITITCSKQHGKKSEISSSLCCQTNENGSCSQQSLPISLPPSPPTSQPHLSLDPPAPGEDGQQRTLSTVQMSPTIPSPSMDQEMLQHCDLYVLQFVMQALKGEMTHTVHRHHGTTDNKKVTDHVIREASESETFLLSIPCKMMNSSAASISTPMDIDVPNENYHKREVEQDIHSIHQNQDTTTQQRDRKRPRHFD